MKPIIQLNQGLINKIAAGEVVERPLSVVKELTENAIDAGASIITVEITDGGLSSVRVTDNGGGIPSEDLPLAFARHATSKITNLDDLFQVETLGFRGEALSSIASVSQVELITKTSLAVMGTRVEIHGGKLLSSRDIGCANGTTIIVSNLFYNTPARRKFLKKPSAEAGYISDCLERLALGNPGLTLRYINNGKSIFHTNGNGDLKTALLNVYGREVATKSINVNADADELRLTGMVGKPEIARGNRQHGSFFINGRYIQSKLLTRAVESAMKTMLPSGKFPVYALSLEMPFDSLDVNVHPTKMDVRFAYEDEVFNFVEKAVQDALETHNLIPTIRQKFKPEENPEEQAEQIPLFIVTPRQSFALQNFATPLGKGVTPPSQANNLIGGVIPDKAGEEPNFSPSENAETEKHTQNSFGLPVEFLTNSFDKPENLPPPVNPNLLTFREEIPVKVKRFFNDYQIIGLAFSTYWLVSQEESIFLIDQHAAHERVLYEEILTKVQTENVPSQQLLIPIPLRLTHRERQILNENKAIFDDFGFQIGGDSETPEILSVPLMIKGPVESSFFVELLDKISDVGFSQVSPYTHKTEMIAMAACKAAIKSGDNTTPQEAEALIKQLLTLDNPFTCPHGRPTIIEITKRELERRFKRS